MDGNSDSRNNLSQISSEPSDSRDAGVVSTGSSLSNWAAETEDKETGGSSVKPLPPLEGSSTPRHKQNTVTIVNAGNQHPGASGQPILGAPPDNSFLLRLFPPQTGSSISDSLDPAGIELAHFRIIDRIARGGMGAVFKALDTKLQRHVALKLLAPTQSFDQASIKRFQNEARAAARLDHENIARVYFIGEQDGLHFIAFEFITGSNIRDMINNQGRLSVADTVNYALQVAYALNHTSGVGVVHRDIKPSNIIITPKGRAKLVDLGLARKDGSESHGELTLPGSTLGTFDYISPEQAKDPRSVDCRSDIYSLGCTMYHMLVGEVPYPDGTVLQKLLDHQNKDIPDVAKKRRNVPPILAAIIRKMMNSDRAKRFQTPDHLIKELTQVAGSVGLRGMNPEGLVWVHSKSARQSTWASHIGWIMTVACLLTIVVLLEFFPELSRNFTGVSGHPIVDKGSPEQHELAQHDREGSGRVDQIPSLDPIKDDSAGKSIQKNGETLMNQMTTQPRPNLPIKLDSADDKNDVSSQAAGVDAKENDVVQSNDDGNIADSKQPRRPGDSSTELKPASTDQSQDNNDNQNATPTVVDQARPFVVYAGDGSIKRRYLTLESAVADLDDGSEIILDFDGRRVEKPLHLSRSNVTIRAANGRTPIVVFESSGPDTQMVTLQAGQARLLNLQFEMKVDQDAANTRYSLFGLSQTSELTLNRVIATVQNDSTTAQVALIESSVGFGEMPDMKMPGKKVDSLTVEISESIIRGDAHLARLGFDKKLDFNLTNTAVALSDDMFQFSVSQTTMADSRLDLEINLNHCTAIVDGSILHFAGPAKVENSSKVVWNSRNSIFSPISASAFVAADENVASEDARRLLSVVTSERNYYNQYAVFWAVPDDNTSFTFADWRDHWGSVIESRTKNDSITWKSQLGTFTSAKAIDFELAQPAQEGAANPAIEGADNGENAGANLDRLPVAAKMPKEQTESTEADDQ